MKKLLGLFLFCGLILLSCGKSNKQYSLDYFEGEVVCFEDTASFYNCVTGSSIAMSTAGAYDKLLSKYNEFKGNDDNPLYVRFRGHFEQDMKAIVIDSLIGTETGSQCNPDNVIAGPYITSVNKAIILLDRDYRYTWIQGYEDNRIPDTLRGRWGMPAASLVVLQQEEPTGVEQQVFSYIPSMVSLASNDPKKKSLIFTRFGEFKNDTLSGK